MVTFVPGPDGDLASMKEAKISQRSRATFLYIGPATVEGARGEWLEVQEELLDAKGLPEGMVASGRAMVTRVFVGPDGKVLRTVVQPQGRPAEEAPVIEGMSVTIGALAPFESMGTAPKAGKETIEVAKLGKLSATTYEASGPGRRTKIWRRTSDGLCLKVLDSMPESGATTYVLTRSGGGGVTKIEGPIQQRTMDADREQWLRAQQQQGR
jgi:hypothetical protein